MKIKFEKSPPIPHTPARKVDIMNETMWLGRPGKRCFHMLRAPLDLVDEPTEYENKWVVFSPFGDPEAFYPSREALIAALRCQCGCGKVFLPEDYTVERWRIQRSPVVGA